MAVYRSCLRKASTLAAIKLLMASCDVPLTVGGSVYGAPMSIECMMGVILETNSSRRDAITTIVLSTWSAFSPRAGREEERGSPGVPDSVLDLSAPLASDAAMLAPLLAPLQAIASLDMLDMIESPPCARALVCTAANRMERLVLAGITGDEPSLPCKLESGFIDGA